MTISQIRNQIQKYLNQFERIQKDMQENGRVKHLNELHNANKHDDLNWRNSKEGKEWRKKYEK